MSERASNVSLAAHTSVTTSTDQYGKKLKSNNVSNRYNGYHQLCGDDDAKKR